MASRALYRQPSEGTYRAQLLDKRVRRATTWYWAVAAGKSVCLLGAGAIYLASGRLMAGLLMPVLLVALAGWLYLRFGGERFYAPDVILRRLIFQESPAAKR